MADTNIPTEAEEQATLVGWLELNGYKFTAIPNSTYTTSQFQKIQNHRLGLRRGLPDLLIILPTKELLFIEMKRQKRHKTSPEQQEWIDALNTIDNVGAYICYGADQAISLIESLLKDTNK